MTKLPAVRLLVDGCQGIYVPMRFTTNFDLSLWNGIDEGCALACQDPDCESYWDAWQDILDCATFTQDGHTWRLEQDGDLWAVCYELMTDEEKHNFGFDD